MADLAKDLAGVIVKDLPAFGRADADEGIPARQRRELVAFEREPAGEQDVIPFQRSYFELIEAELLTGGAGFEIGLLIVDHHRVLADIAVVGHHGGAVVIGVHEGGEIAFVPVGGGLLHNGDELAGVRESVEGCNCRGV